MTHPSLDATVGETVAQDIRSAAVFARHGIDFCCGGRKSIGEACHVQALDPDEMLEELRALEAQPADGTDLTTVSADALIDRVVTRHHGYVREQIPLIEGYLQKLASKHGHTRAELTSVTRLFASLASELTRHMEKEEKILFPYIRAMSERERAGTVLPPMPFGTIRNPIRMMEGEHQEAARELSSLRTATGDYAPPSDACKTWRACYAALEAFEHDLHQHVHLENSLLFPAAVLMEDRLSASR